METLEQKARRLAAKIDARAYQIKKNAANSAAYKVATEASAVQRFWFQIGVALWWIWQHIAKPVLRPFWWLGRKVFWWYVRLWDRKTITTDQYGNERRSVKRAGIMLTTTLVVLYCMPAALELAFDVGLYAVTAERHTVYLKGITEKENDVHATGGCDVLGCSSNDTQPYRVRPLLFNTMWSMIANFEWSDWYNPFIPDAVARTIPQETAKCDVLTWGLRQKFLGRGLYQSWDMYADLIKVYSCEKV